MTVLDAYAVIASLLGEAADAEVEPLLRATGSTPKLSAVNLAEVIDRLVRLRGISFDDVLDRIIWLAAGGLEIVEPDVEIGSVAGYMRSRHYRRRERDLSLADCFALATASVLEDSIATPDHALAATARDEGIDVIALPDSSGRRPA